jgi:chromosome segregation ATPase
MNNEQVQALIDASLAKALTPVAELTEKLTKAEGELTATKAELAELKKSHEELSAKTDGSKQIKKDEGDKKPGIWL